MSIGPLGGLFASAAGTGLSQASGSDVERAKHDATDQQRQVDATRQAESAAGIAETDGQEHQSNERDADGRRPWEIGPAQKKPAAPDQDPAAARQSKDATGQSGGQLDLTG